MQPRFVILAHVPTDSVTRGFIPAIRRRALPLLLVTDQPERHRRLIDDGLLQADELLAADVFNPLAVLNALAERQIAPLAVFSNSDHLQSATAIVGSFFGLPGKDWRACLRAKNKLVMRRTIEAAGLDNPWFRCVSRVQELDDVPLPCIAKPVEGVASEDVSLVQSREELEQVCRAFWQRHPGQSLLLEEYLAGPLHTLETLGDGARLEVMGSFETFLSPPPAFIELGQHLQRRAAPEVEAVVLAQLRALGVGFGSCHTEFVLTERGPRLIEVNYRNIGDQSDFLLAQALDFDLFDALIGLYLGEPLPTLPESALGARIHCQSAEHSGIVTQVPEACRLERDGCRIEFTPLCKLGERIERQHSNRDYLGILRGIGPNDALLEATLNTLATELAVIIDPLSNPQEAA
ncbi:ATP-grasp domain-containing protein [Marinobacterium sp. D7]|uniref:ATP-grasp domain-containing protein n=1 Tax=Marinobacterium ramblicola TaxID=2849041 RepID=UPI001C2D237D|nr:ATP-grasp domain-containing protein [Marinobacterium ramblicola]MBV1786819.1 ATP-grasp domain-containing protein [Marinobacterium ramblicola]